MDLHHTGFDELFYIETDKVSITVKGNTSLPSAPGVSCSEEISELRVACSDPVNCFQVMGENMNKAVALHKITPMFFEQRQYEVVIEGFGENKVEFWHINKNIRDKVTPISRRSSLLSGIINFGNEIGLSDLVIFVNGQEYLKITIEIFPSKLSYREDYKAIVKDVTDEVYNLIFDFLKKTYHGYNQSGNRKSSSAEFFSIILEIFDDFERATNKIIHQPHHLLETTHEIKSFNKIKRVDNQTIRWAARHPEHAQVVDGNIRVQKALAVNKQVTFDNNENRITKFMLKNTIKRLDKIGKQYIELQRDTDEEIIEIISQMKKRIERLINHSFLSGVSDLSQNIETSLVFSMAPGYRELYKYYLMLQRGLDITGNVFDISIKDLAVLYEYWCFIKLNSILKDKYDLISQDIIRTEGNRLVVSLIKGRNSEIKYRNTKNGELIKLSYNPKEIGSPTVSQKPDNVLSLEKNSLDATKPKYEYVFDAKYKIDPAVKGSHYYNCISTMPGPKEEDINTMHRYRDAIVSESGADNFERTMFGAYVLFPYSDEEKYKAHKFYKSINKVNVGGLPFLPSATELVEEMLEDLINDSPETAFERTTLPVGIEDKLAKTDWNKKDVLVGKVNDPAQLKEIIDEKIYYLDCDKIDEKSFPINYVALYQSGSVFKEQSGIYLYGEVIRCEKVYFDKQYFKFIVREWINLQRPISIKEYAESAMFTNMFLLQHSFNVSDLRIDSEEEYRVYYEIKRLVNNESLNEIGVERCFKYGDFVIDYDNGDIRISNRAKILKKYSAALFNKRPNYCFREIKNDLKLK